MEKKAEVEDELIVHEKKQCEDKLRGRARRKRKGMNRNGTVKQKVNGEQM